MTKSIYKKCKKYKQQCPCGGGQSCIVARRQCKDRVHEDDVLKKAKLPIRKNCHSKFTKKQEKAMSTFFARMSDEGFTSISISN